jgi:hypothetical protein
MLPKQSLPARYLIMYWLKCIASHTDRNAGASPGVPLRLTGNNSYGNFDLAPATVAKIYDQILADLNAAETDLPL